MGLKSFLMNLLHRKSQPEALESAAAALVIDLKHPVEALESAPTSREKPQEKSFSRVFEEPSELSPPIELQKDSLQLGVAAGYTGRFIKDVESSLSRIESHMTTKDWFTSKFWEQIQQITQAIKEHDSNSEKRFESIQNLLNSLQKTAEKVPEPIKTELFEQIRTIEKELPLTSKMKELISVVKEAKEISYQDLTTRLKITQSSLRGLLANTMKRTSEIERFRVDNKGWVRYKGI